MSKRKSSFLPEAGVLRDALQLSKAIGGRRPATFALAMAVGYAWTLIAAPILYLLLALAYFGTFVLLAYLVVRNGYDKLSVPIGLASLLLLIPIRWAISRRARTRQRRRVGSA